MKDKSPLYFPGLHALRFIAAITVVFGHIELIKKYMGISHMYDIPVVKESGRIAVSLFFVLSGFLISYLLLEEKKRLGHIHLKAFFIRRILRIWPLYYFLVVLSFFVFPHFEWFSIGLTDWTHHFQKNLLLYSIFLPQLALSIYPQVPFAEPAWSIGVEEQFYLFWPLAMQYLKKLAIWATLLCLVFIIVRHISYDMYLHESTSALKRFWGRLYGFFYLNRIECMIIGAAYAWLLHSKHRMLSFLYKPLVRLGSYAILAFIIVLGSSPLHHHSFHALLFGILIINLASNPNPFISLEHPLLRNLGKISFGIYMLHEIVIVSAIKTLAHFHLDLNNHFCQVLLYIFVPIGSILLAWLSYRFLERPFLRIKKKHQLIATSDKI